MKKFLVSIAVAALAAPMFAQSAPSRVAVIDVQKVIAQSSAGKSEIERLKKLQDERIARAQKMDEEIRTLESDLSTKKLSLSEEKLTDMSKQLAEKKISIQRYTQDADREVGEARDKALAGLNTRIMPLVDQIGKEMGIAVIFNKFESGLIYAADAIDITDTVIKRFNDGGSTAGKK